MELTFNKGLMKEPSKSKTNAYFSNRYGNKRQRKTTIMQKRDSKIISRRITVTARDRISRSPIESLSPHFGGLAEVRIKGALPFSGKDYCDSSKGMSGCSFNHKSLQDTTKTRQLVHWEEMSRGIAIIDKIVQIGACMGQGGFANVFKCYDRSRNKEVALKVMVKDELIARGKTSLIEREVTVMQILNHINICKFDRLLEDNEKIYLILELCGPYTLNKYCRKQRLGRLEESEAKTIFYQIIQGVKHIHDAGYCHRDLKLTNILINSNKLVKIIDFGFAYDADRMITEFCGTPSYVAPEIMKGRPHYGKPVDIWALGVVLYKLLTGEYPFGGRFNV